MVAKTYEVIVPGARETCYLGPTGTQLLAVAGERNLVPRPRRWPRLSSDHDNNQVLTFFLGPDGSVGPEKKG